MGLIERYDDDKDIVTYRDLRDGFHIDDFIEQGIEIISLDSCE
jgi:hypothetical protein